MGTPLLLCLLLTPQAAPSAPEASPSVRRAWSVMGTHLSVELDAPDRAAGLARCEAAFRAVQRTEERLSTWSDRSELARLNAATVGEPFSLSEALEAELRVALRLWRETGGCFDAGVGGLVEAWGLRSGGKRADPREIERALAPRGLSSLRLEPGRATRVHPDLRLEEGAFGKGAALDRALAALRDLGVASARIDLGGQIALLGDRPATVVLARPGDRRSPLVRLHLTGGCVATSGNDDHPAGRRGIGHVLDPRTGRPATGAGSVTVVAESGLVADALSTALFVMGPERALAWAEARPDIEVLILLPPAGDSGDDPGDRPVLEPEDGQPAPQAATSPPPLWRVQISSGLEGRVSPLPSAALHRDTLP